MVSRNLHDLIRWWITFCCPHSGSGGAWGATRVRVCERKQKAQVECLNKQHGNYKSWAIRNKLFQETAGIASVWSPHPLRNRASTDRTKSNCCAAVVTFLGPTSFWFTFSFCFYYGFLFISSLGLTFSFCQNFCGKNIWEKFCSHDHCPPWESCPSKFVNLCYPLSDFSPTTPSLPPLSRSPAVRGRIVSSVK